MATAHSMLTPGDAIRRARAIIRALPILGALLACALPGACAKKQLELAKTGVDCLTIDAG